LRTLNKIRKETTMLAFVRSRFRIAILGLLFGTAAWADPVSLPLADNGQALQPIVLSEKASDATKQAAAELASYLGQITGAKFQVKTGDGSVGIVLGTLEEFPNPALDKPLTIRNTYDGKEAYAIRTESKRLLLIGATDRATPHAAFRLLESLGCRWFFPAKAWEVVPSLPKLMVQIEETDRPRILSRLIVPGFGYFVDKGHPAGLNAMKDFEGWMRHNRMGHSFRPNCGHAWQNMFNLYKIEFDEHPEYRALVADKRQGFQLCVSNAEVRKLAVRYALDYLARNPQADMAGMECSDGAGHCECEECKKLGSISDRLFGLSNEVAREVDKKYPGKMVGMYAYNEHSVPPSFPLEPNLHVQLTAGFNLGPYRHEQLVEMWPKVSKNFGAYVYYSLWGWDADKLPGGLAPNLAASQEMLKKYLKGGAISFQAEAGNNWGLCGRGYYVTSKLLWNPEVNVSETLTDFYDKAFGPAAPAMKRYYERLAPDSYPLISRSLVGEAFRDVDEASRLAKDRPDVLARIDQMKHYLRYVHLRWQIDHEKNQAAKKKLTLEALTFGYRTRYEYMNHWAAIWQDWSVRAAAEFNEPTWARTSKESKPWAVDAPVTSEETAAWFREGQKYFPARANAVPEINFSNDLVPVAFPDAKPVALSQHYQGFAKFILYSHRGEPLELEITPGLIPGYRGRADASYTLKDLEGQVAAEGTFKLEPSKHAVVMKAPRAGAYVFEFNDSAAGWSIKAKPGQSVVLLEERPRSFNHSGTMQELFFYVPKGTTTLHYFWHGGPHKVLGPNKQLIRDVQATDDIVNVAVPPGAAGKVWSFSPCAHGRLWFFNAPNCFAASPGGLLVPRELAKADGLTPVK
jgi:Domain of unknown function (DUF4838)